ncbi:MAG: deoxyuridine 5'-triphosphate nucleotidohydrolase [Acidobacteria bacterium 21-70-11]|nr:MAG: deoxyuridine 5'-triphosphate nucleotidohydrolase [Acidobacteria bacterium 21-70-11]OYW01156.1 MAG: deoxyuridine 5'-triphosphate nucleotidohydrolase [Acidobacteria bacterium 37-71-11]HQT93072.1 dUTP diphosphatase [Thermoanaerobaculaceae bacterium]
MSAPIVVAVRRLAHGDGLPLPRFATAGAAGADVAAAVESETVLAPMERRAVPTGLVLAVPPGYEVQVRPRSGLALRQGLTVANAPGTVDSDYRGELMVVLVNLGDRPCVVRRGERIAQLVVAPVVQAAFEERADLPPSARGAGGFGSTGA